MPHTLLLLKGMHPSLPPSQVMELMMTEVAMADRCQSIRVDESDMLQAVVPSISDSMREYATRVEKGFMSCECGLPQISGMPDRHVIYHADSVGVAWEDLLSGPDSVEGWKQQYPADLHFTIPSSSAVEASPLIDENLLLPPMIHKGRGHPRVKCHKGFLEGGGKGMRKTGGQRARPTCSNCKQVGHNSRGCKNMPRD